jgi:hypothetical protein
MCEPIDKRINFKSSQVCYDKKKECKISSRNVKIIWNDRLKFIFVA